ncbi:hypothetical protein NQD34_017217 [Periophthalmus magnuspinnatus]|nr:hypothetical protein NQD34_017217 [Periophthalmus magnuspinnatus]
MSKTKSKPEKEKTEKVLAAEKEQFNKQQLQSISKIVSTAEVPPKEKYVRNIILGTHKESGATTFWSYTSNVPLSSNSMVSWKFCYLLHKVLRDGHRNSVVDSSRHTRGVKDMGVLWGNLHDRYGHIVALYAKFLCLKIEFHNKYKMIPGNLEATDETLERQSGSDMTKVLDITNELLDYLDAALKMAETVFRQFDANGAKSTTASGQCRLTPLIPLILDCGFLYHFSVLLMFKLHSRIAPDILLGHRERYRDMFMSLKQFFSRARETEFFKTFIQIPELPDEPPNFLRAAALGEYKKQVVVTPGGDYPEDDEEQQPESRDMSQYYLLSQIGMPEAPIEEKETKIDPMKRELEAINPEVQLIKSEAQRCVVELKAKVNHLESELEEQRTHKQMAMVENEHLRMAVEALQSTNVANVGAQLGFKEADSRAQAAELRFAQLKERHAELVSSHADLLKKNAETAKVLSFTKQDYDNIKKTKEQLESEVENLRLEKGTMMSKQLAEVDNLNKELLEQRAEMALLRSTLENKEKSGNYLNSTLSGVQAEKEALLRSLREQESELTSLRQQAQAHQSLLQQERQRSSVEVSSLQAQLQQQACREGELSQKLQDEQFCLLQCAVVEAEGIILDALAKVDDPIHVRCISSPDYLINRAQTTLASIDKMQQSHLVYLGNRNDASGLLRAVTQFSHLAADTIVNGAATSHSAPTDHADHLTENCRECATHCLNFLRDLKSQSTLQRADPAAIRYTVQRLLDIGHALRPKGQDILQEELGTLVDKEMLATSTAIEEAVLRMDEILSQVKNDTTGIKLEVNQSILGSCSDLMKAIHMLVTAATDLQKDIVEEGRGATSIKEFYARNSRWTEGLISASKAVGWGATQLLESADRVVGENGTYEELIASSHEIAASTAQLVAASKVKADRNNKKLHTLQMASRHVNDMAAVVVTSTKHGQKQISDTGADISVGCKNVQMFKSNSYFAYTGVMDFSGMSLIKLKKEEMEAQVKVLQLENQLEQERVRLGELRKRHYDLGGADAEENEESFPPPPPPTLLDSTATSQPHLNTQSLAPTNPFTQTQTTSQSQPYTPATGFFSQSNTPPQTYSSMYSHAPSLTSSTAYTPTQPFVPSQPYVPPQHYTPDQLYTPSQMYTPAQPHSPKPQRHLQPSASQTAGQNSKESTRLKKPNIFTKSGNLLKNAFKKGESGTGESSGNHS